MVFCSFIRSKCCAVDIKFFQSSANYLNNQALTKYWNHYTKLYNGDGPHPSQHSHRVYLGFGHYGLYYSIFNRDSDNYRTNNINILFFNPLINFHLPIYEDAFRSEDHIPSQVLKLGDARKSSSFSFAVSKRNFSTYTRRSKDSISSVLTKISEQRQTELKDTNENIESVSKEATAVPIDNMATQEQEQGAVNEPAALTGDFAHLHSSIDTLYATKQLHLIYPIYQSLKRNNQPLRSVDAYNKVLQSIVSRDVDASGDLEAIESRLTNLLTVYQDLLAEVKPTNETFNLVVCGLLDGSISSIKYNGRVNLPRALYNDSFVKSQEFILVTLELLMSIKDITQLNLNVIYPKLFQVLNEFPNLINKEILSVIFNNLISGSNYFNYHHQLINLTEHFMKFGLLKSNKESYDFLFHLYENYKQGNFDSKSDFKIYQSLMVQLIRTDNFEISTRFLDDILLQYRSKSFDKKDISNLISKYLLEVSQFDLIEALKLMKEFNQVSFIPELSMEFNNEMINRLIAAYPSADPEQRQTLYESIWETVNYNLIRKDFKLNSNLVAFAIDLNDYDNVFKLSKILLLSNDLIDLPVLKKLLSYYSHGLAYNFEVYYDLSLKLIEHQARFYDKHGKLNDFFSEVVDFLVIPNSDVVLKSLINSTVINDVFRKFDLVNDKIYGLIKFAKYLQEQNSSTEQLKVLHLQALLINEFENPELVYVNLDDDLAKFKSQLLESFKLNAKDLAYVTAPMIDAFRYLDIDRQGKKIVQVEQVVNLSTIFNTNYHIGVAQFLDLFKKGCKFTDETLEILINKEFLHNHLHKININKFVKMYRDERLLKALVKENIDSLTIAVLKNAEIDEEIFNLVLDNCLTSNNKYLFTLFNSIRIPLDGQEMIKYLQVLKKNQEFEQIDDIFTANPELSSNVPALVVYLDALLNTKQFDKFNEVVKTRFNDKKSLNVVLENDDLRSLINDYYLISNTEVPFFKPKKHSDVNKLTNDLVNHLNNPSNLQTVYRLNSKLINVNQQLVIGNLLTKILNYNLSYKLLWNFCKIADITKISIVNFKKLIQIMSNDEVKLSVLFQRFINHKVVNYIKFEFFEVLINETEKMEILRLFKDCFKRLKSDVNLAKIDVVLNE